jgi:predicted negative regulator of RcsB-dependent stress response
MDFGSYGLIAWFDSLIDSVVKHKTKVMIGLLSLAVLVSSFFVYRYYHHKIQIEAHQDFMEALSAFDVPIQGYRDRVTPVSLYFNSEEDKWRKVLELFEHGSKRHSRSGLGAMFKLFYAEALLQVNRYPEALVIMKETVETVKSEELREVYRVKLSLMQLDNSRVDEINEGLERLKAMAFNQQNIAQSQALYHLGYYFWINKKFDEAKSYWQQFLVKFGDQAGFAEQIKLVKSRLELTAV